MAATIPEENTPNFRRPSHADATEPITVVTAPQATATRYRAIPAPASVATPLDTSLPPLAAANAIARTATASVIGRSVSAHPGLTRRLPWAAIRSGPARL
ncbi:hypothetical protein GCM10027360_87330 [Amycolatopsis echigonensis]